MEFENHRKKSHSTLRAKRATFTFFFTFDPGKHFWISFKELEWFGSEFQKSLKKFSKKCTEKNGQKFTEKNH